MAEDNRPVYLSQSEVAKELYVTRAAVANWLVRYPESIPQPAAWVRGRAGLVPLWTVEQLPAWRRWLIQAVSER